MRDARASSRTLLTELESKQLLSVYGIPTVETVLVGDEAAALEVARQEGIARVVADILPDNRKMQRICQRLGFDLERPLGEPVVRATITVKGTEERAR